MSKPERVVVLYQMQDDRIRRGRQRSKMAQNIKWYKGRMVAAW